ncbi:MAG: ABC transporter substrate-binding protein [Patescibacteria group bacterium]
MNKILIGVGVLVVIALSIFALSNTSPGTPSTITIGVIAPLSGQYGFLGESERNAMLMAQEDLAAKGQTVRLIFEDDKYEARTGLTAYQKLKNIDNVDALIAVSAPILEVLKPVVAEDKMLMLSLGESQFHENDTVFQLMPASDKIAPKLGEESAKRFKNIAVVYSASGSLWKGWHDDFVKGVGAGAHETTFAMPADSDLRTETAKMVASKPDATTVFLPLEEGIKFLKNLKTLDPLHSIKIICDGNMEFSIQKYIDEVGSEIFADCISTTLPNTMTASFTAAYKAKFNADPILTADYAYDAVMLIADIANKSPDTWVAQLNNEYSLQGASGEVRFNSVGTRNPEVVVHQFKDGKFVEID